MITVQEALNLPSLKEAQVVAGASGLDREMDWFHILDIPQVVPWIRKDRILITVGYAIAKEPEIQDALIENLNAKGIVGMIITIGLYLDEVPVGMKEAADRLGFPLITLSSSHHLETITRELAEKLLVNNDLFARYAEWYQKIMETVGENDALCGITGLATEITESQVVLLDNYGRLLTIGKSNDYYKNLDGFLKHFRENELRNNISAKGLPQLGFNGEIHYFYYRIDTKEQDCLFLVVLTNIKTVHFSKLMLIAGIASAISALLNSNEVLRRTVQSANIPLLENILYGHYASEGQAFREVSRVGWDFNTDHIVVTFEISSFDEYIIKYKLPDNEIINKRAMLLKVLAEKIMAIQGKYPLSKQELKWITIFQLANKDSLKKITQACQEIVDYFKEEHEMTINIGISSIVRDLAGFCNRVNETNACIKIGKELNKGNVYRYDELGMEIILYKILQDEDVKQNYLNKVQILIDYDNKYNLKIFETLKTYVLNQGNMAMAARSLDVHRNTIKYRLNKAEELLDLNLSSTNSFLNLAILLRIYEINNSANGLALN